MASYYVNNEALQQESARKAAAEELDRYRTQMDRLAGLFGLQQQSLGRSEDLAARMQDSLRRQLLLQAQVRGTLAAVDATRVQEQTNTVRVLRTMWDDANRIHGGRIAVVASYSCSVVGSGKDFPAILGRDAEVELRVAPASALAALRRPADSFASNMTLTEGVDFWGVDQQLTTFRSRSVDGDEVTQLSRFSPLRAEDMGALATPEGWRDVALEVIISGDQPGLTKMVREAMTGEEIGGKERLAKAYFLPAELRDDDDYSVFVLPCTVEMAVLVNDRLVANGKALPVQVQEWDEDRRAKVVVKFPVVRANRDVFPTFLAAN